MRCQAGGCMAEATSKGVCGTCRNYGDSATRNYCANHKNNALPCGHVANYFWAAGYRFPNTRSKHKVATTLNCGNDWSVATTYIDSIRNLTSRRFVFVGETHSSCYDKANTRRLARRYGGDDRVILVVERGILPDGFWPDGRPENVVEERDRESPSGSAERNENLVAQFRVICEDDDAVRGIRAPQPVVILCGDDHGDKLLDETVKQMPYFRDTRGVEAPSTIHWTHFESAADTLGARATVAAGNWDFVGFIEFTGGDYSGAQEVSLLEKGVFHGAFDVTVLNHAMLVGRFDNALVKTVFHFALYMPAGAAQNQVLQELDTDGETRLRITSIHLARLVTIDSIRMLTDLCDQSRREARAREA